MPEIEFRIGGQSVVIEGDSRDTILDSALRHQVSAPYSCLEGVCQSCRAKLVSGAVVGDVDSEASILTCQTRPAQTQGRVIIDYDI